MDAPAKAAYGSCGVPRDILSDKGDREYRRTGMLNGFYFVRGDGSTQYSMTFPRGGLAATFVLQALQRVGATPILTVLIEHKNHDDTTWSSAGSFAAINAVGIYTVDITLLKEQIRFSYMIAATNQWEGYLLSLLAPAWRPYV